MERRVVAARVWPLLKKLPWRETAPALSCIRPSQRTRMSLCMIYIGSTSLWCDMNQQMHQNSNCNETATAPSCIRPSQRTRMSLCMIYIGSSALCKYIGNIVFKYHLEIYNCSYSLWCYGKQHLHRAALSQRTRMSLSVIYVGSNALWNILEIYHLTISFGNI